MIIYRNSNLKKIKYILVSLSCIIILILTTKSNIIITNTFCLWTLGFLYLSLFLIFIFDKMNKKFSKIERKSGIYILVSIISLFVCWLMPFRYNDIVDDNIVQQSMRNNSNIIIEALGEKNDTSQGFEVCLEGIRMNGQDYNLYNIKLNDGWQFVDGRPIHKGQLKSRIQIDLGNVNTYEIMLRKNQNAGKVYVKIGKNGYIYDLYSKKPIQHYTIDISKIFLQNIEKDNKINLLLFYCIYFFIIEMLVFSLIIFLISKRKKNQIVIEKFDR